MLLNTNKEYLCFIRVCMCAQFTRYYNYPNSYENQIQDSRNERTVKYPSYPGRGDSLGTILGCIESEQPWKESSWIHSKLFLCVLVTLVLFACVSIYAVSIIAEMRKETRTVAILFYNSSEEIAAAGISTNRSENSPSNNRQSRVNFEQIEHRIMDPNSDQLGSLAMRPYILTFKGGNPDEGTPEYTEPVNLLNCISPEFTRFVYRFYLSYELGSWSFYPHDVNGQGIQGLSFDSLVNFSLCCKMPQGEFQCSESQYLENPNSSLVAIIVTNHENGRQFLKIKFTQTRLLGAQCILNFVSEECK